MRKELIGMIIFLAPVCLSAHCVDSLVQSNNHDVAELCSDDAISFGHAALADKFTDHDVERYHHYESYEYSKQNVGTYSIDTTSSYRTNDSYARNISFVGLFFVADGLLVKACKPDFQSIQTYFKPDFKTTLDNYCQYAPMAATFALKALGVKSASNWKRMTVNSAMSYLAMAAIVRSVKYTSHEMRPDNSDANSFPSGHTATAFAGATIFHKEYGYMSPWYSIGGYLAAAAVGTSRILHNRHWISDVLVGAGVGIVSTDIGYFLGDLLLKGKGIEHQRKYGKPDISYSPSFMSLTIGTGAGPGYINAPDIYDSYDEHGTPTGNPMNLKLKTGRTVAVNAEGAYFLNDYLGIGGRLRAMTIPFTVESFNQKTSSNDHGFDFYVPDFPDGSSNSNQEPYLLESLESHQLGMIDLSGGIFVSYPITSRLRVGTKFLVGDKITTGLSMDALFRINQKRPDYSVLKENFEAMLNDGPDKNDNISRDELDRDLYHLKDFMKLKNNNTLTVGTGINFTYAYKENVSLKLFVDYDYAHPNYTYELNNRYDKESNVLTDTFKTYTTFHIFTGGVGMEVYF
jgi:hypothetical protein